MKTRVVSIWDCKFDYGVYARKGPANSFSLHSPHYYICVEPKVLVTFVQKTTSDGISIKIPHIGSITP